MKRAYASPSSCVAGTSKPAAAIWRAYREVVQPDPPALVAVARMLRLLEVDGEALLVDPDVLPRLREAEQQQEPLVVGEARLEIRDRQHHVVDPHATPPCAPR